MNRNPAAAADGPTVRVCTDDGTLTLYDTAEDEAWLASEAAVDLAEMA